MTSSIPRLQIAERLREALSPLPCRIWTEDRGKHYGIDVLTSQQEVRCTVEPISRHRLITANDIAIIAIGIKSQLGEA
jgi:hypothetical protein